MCITVHKVGNRWVKAPRRAIASALADKFLFLIWKSKGRQPLGESPSPKRCVGVSRLVLRNRIRQSIQALKNGLKARNQ
ncbi:MAG: hypothetical protein LBU34_05645 [Planctomycetaceae bacterium]|jgi:hypothetical protein|nr:hypothetical protein [Planctomycetaceae bacterium]